MPGPFDIGKGPFDLGGSAGRARGKCVPARDPHSARARALRAPKVSLNVAATSLGAGRGAMPPPAQGDGVGESGTDAGDAQQRRTASGAAAAASGVPGGESPREASAAPADASRKGKAAAVPLPERLHEALEATTP